MSAARLRFDKLARVVATNTHTGSIDIAHAPHKRARADVLHAEGLVRDHPGDNLLREEACHDEDDEPDVALLRGVEEWLLAVQREHAAVGEDREPVADTAD